MEESSNNGRNSLCRCSEHGRIILDDRHYGAAYTGARWKKPPFNAENGLKADFPFIVSDEIAAMSVMAAGGEAVGLCTENVEDILYIFKDSSRKQCFILALNDTADGAEIQKELISKIKDMDIRFVEADSNIPINDMLKTDKNAFNQFVTKLKEKAAKIINPKTAFKPYVNHKSVEKSCNFICESNVTMPTGFKGLDNCLRGGFPVGLNFIGAPPGMGKTSLCGQMADQSARQGNDVLFFTLEMDPDVRISNGISRQTYFDNGAKTTKTDYGMFSLAKNAFDIKAKPHAEHYSEKEKEAIRKAASRWDTYGSYITFYNRDVLIENGGKALENVLGIIEDYAKIHDKFIIFIDYFQLLTRSMTNKFTERGTVDEVVARLKDVTFKYKCPIVCISATNRSSYDSGANISDFKESGNIEYIAETLMSLQIPGMDASDDDKSEQKRKNRIQALKDNFYKAKKKTFEGVPIQLKILKARYKTQDDIFFRARYAFAYFEEMPESEAYLNASTAETGKSLTTKNRRTA